MSHTAPKTPQQQQHVTDAITQDAVVRIRALDRRNYPSTASAVTPCFRCGAIDGRRLKKRARTDGGGLWCVACSHVGK